MQHERHPHRIAVQAKWLAPKQSKSDLPMHRIPLWSRKLSGSWKLNGNEQHGDLNPESETNRTYVYCQIFCDSRPLF